MSIHSGKNNSLVIQFLSYDKPTENLESFYFLEMSTLQATTLLPATKKIIHLKIEAHTKDYEYLAEETTETFKTIGAFNAFFLNNPHYHLHNCEIEFENGLVINSHDDGEVSIRFSENTGKELVNFIFKKYNLDNSLIDFLKNKPGHYIAIDKQGKVTGDFENFNACLKNGRK